MGFSCIYLLFSECPILMLSDGGAFSLLSARFMACFLPIAQVEAFDVLGRKGFPSGRQFLAHQSVSNLINSCGGIVPGKYSLPLIWRTDNKFECKIKLRQESFTASPTSLQLSAYLAQTQVWILVP